MGFGFHNSLYEGFRFWQNLKRSSTETITLKGYLDVELKENSSGDSNLVADCSGASVSVGVSSV